ncbi:MAG: 2-amino-4-hydroxy-6-hydroxymethyldihydropteridine diphosphokinase [Defluviitaleaceae bacterium]|nr:2-amino-4-hydroxy-6-hydroxymethyldihydropteridine diphosphokinase [Defluviitaleaceae bacterium]
MDKILIDGLEIFANHGVLEAEKQLGQKFIISAELELDLRSAGKTDDLSRTINYAEICDGIATLAKMETFDLIETCAEKIASYILQSYPSVKAVRVKVEKPAAPIKHSLRTVAIEIRRKRAQIYLGLGSNIGDTKLNLDVALEKIRHEGINVTACSSYHRTKPVGPIPQDDYLNCVAQAETLLTPQELIKNLLEIESALGRVREERWGPRIIDIDVLFYDDLICSNPDIILPHPRLHERLFVLEPFCELNPYYVHPLLNQRIIDLLTDLQT